MDIKYKFSDGSRIAGRYARYFGMVVGIGLLGIASAHAAEESVLGKGADITKMCGTKDLKVALSDGFGGNTWRKTVEAEFRDEASKCPNIKEVLYTDAGGDQQKYNSDINSLVAQGVNVIVAFPDFGEASIPAFRSAVAAGVTVVPYFSIVKGKMGTDISGNVVVDQPLSGKLFADWYGTTLKKGNLIFLGGIPGAASSVAYLNGFKDGLKAYPDLKLLDDNYVVTNWNPADAQKAVTGLLAKYPKIDGLATDYGVTALAAARVFEQAGQKIPPIATIASNQELNCKYDNDKKAGKGWSYYSLDGSTTLVRFALRRAVALAEGTKDPDTDSVLPYAYADSAKSVDPACDPAAPPDADLSTLLSADQLKTLFKK